MGPTDPTFSKNKKIILQNIGHWLFLIYFFFFFFFFLFCYLKKKEIKHNEHINNHNQEAFIVIIINYVFRVFSSAMQNNIF